jgi:hypothetical protein
MKTLLLCFFLIASFSASGQKIHELKADVLLPFFQGAHLSYEYIPNGKLGIEFEARYRWGVDGRYVNPPENLDPAIFWEYKDAPQKVLTLSLAGKYYPLKSKNGSELFLGAYLRNDLLVSKKDNIYKVLLVPEYSSAHQDDRRLRNGFGALAGYKYVFGEHWVIEIGAGFDVNLDVMFNSDNDELDFACIPTLKAGYRF